jgi:hypothetical protein
LIALAGILVMLCALLVKSRGPRPSDVRAGTNAVVQQVLDQVLRLEAQENEVDQTIWAKDLVADQCGQVFEALWDSLNAATNKWAVLAGFPPGEILPPQFGPPQALAHGIQVWQPLGAATAWPAHTSRDRLTDWQQAGWELVQTEFRHISFETEAGGRPQRSVFAFRAHLRHATRPERASLEGDLAVDWAPEPGEDNLPRVRRIDASQLVLKTSSTQPPFTLALQQELQPPPGSHFIDPLIVYDLDGDGPPEIILAARNIVFRRRSDGRFESSPFASQPPGLIFTGLIADFDGDGMADFLCARFEGLVLLRGAPGGRFEQPGRLVWAAQPRLKYAQALTCGDIDRDGDLDVWLGQYKGPYDRGQMPTPYYDANDGHPAYLLLNDGQGDFVDGTDAAGLAKKRWRRSYSGSFVDLDEDGDLDLLVVSDFAGVDLYANDRQGRFNDMTARWLPQPHAFGMAHAVADFNADGRLDLLVVGMTCPTARRLDHLRLGRPGYQAAEAMRARMTAGNLLALGQAGGGFQQTPINATIARSGWSWGCSAFDLDNDGFLDVAIANGHESKQSVRDYESEFWRHDLYVGRSQDDVAVGTYFGVKFARTRGHGHSYGGYEKNRLYLNQQGAGFVEAGHLFGVALEEDSRNVVADDLDGDGRVDLLVTTFEVWPRVRQTLRVFQNTLPDPGNWIGLRLREQGHGASPVGARATLKAAGRTTTRQIITGDSHRSQHPNTLRFGLGHSTRVDALEIRWANGKTLRLVEPAINRYHDVPAPATPRP